MQEWSDGAFGEKSYLFGYYGDFPKRCRSNKIGFRLARNLSETASAGAEDLPPVEVPFYKRSRLFHLLNEPRRVAIVESGHVPPPEIFAPAANDWFDETLGKVF